MNRVDADLAEESRMMELIAHRHFEYFLQLKVFAAWRKATRAILKHHQQLEALTRAQSVMNQVRLLGSFREWRTQKREAQKERKHMEKAKQHHNSKLLSKVMKAWKLHHCQYLKYKVMKRQGILLLRLKTWQTYFEQWKTELQHRRRTAKQTERALWHWSLTLQAKVLYRWRLWVTEQCHKREHAARAAQIYRDQLLREGVTSILTYAVHMNSLTSSLVECSRTQPRPETSLHLQKVVHRCAMRWKQRALCKPGREKESRRLPPKKSVTFCFPTSDVDSKSHHFSQTDSKNGAQLLSETETQSMDTDGYFGAPLQSHACTAPHQLAPSSLRFQPHTVPVSLKPSSTVDSLQDVLLPPSAFMVAPGTQLVLEKIENAPLVPSHQFIQASADQGFVVLPHDVRLRTSDKEADHPKVKDGLTDPRLTLTQELFSIRMDMNSFQQDRKQLRAWRKLKEVLNAWLQTSGKDEHVEKNLVFQELKELEERIDRLSSELEERKETMRLHAERIKYLQTAVSTSGVETERSVFTT
ncbi:protein SFI1 homolog [Thalassophryne amazonica]|uniref:protein SFI1 homolog n=1 Tax=Thalassophryne amazonica TaxID=390379 RepID=UPI0014716F46|nr:protein SFI1 homolog [Thalassophryne amazonica]